MNNNLKNGFMEWKNIKGYEGTYEISDTGIVLSKDRMIVTAHGKTRFVRKQILKPKKNSDGYLFVTLSSKGKTKNHYIHRLVAIAFVENEENKPEVNHLNGIKTCNRSTNLAWVTHAENIQHAYDSGLAKKGLKRYNARKLRDKASDKIYGSIVEAAEELDINYKTLRNMLSGSNANTTTLEYKEG